MIGELQLQVMEVLWKSGDATVAEVHEALQERRALAYTTVLSTLRGLEKRGYVGHTKEGKAHRFQPRVSRDQHTQTTVDSLVSSLFRGEPEQLMSHLLGDEKLDGDALARIRKLLGEEGA